MSLTEPTTRPASANAPDVVVAAAQLVIDAWDLEAGSLRRSLVDEMGATFDAVEELRDALEAIRDGH